MLPSVKTFISYSHDSPEHVQQVACLAAQLREDGIDVALDLWVSTPPEGWPQWMERQIRGARFVLVICTDTYNHRSRGEESQGRGLGVRWESLLTYQHIYDADSLNNRFVPVLLRREDEVHIPTPLRATSYYCVAEAAGYQLLYRRLTDQPLYPEPPVGKLKRMPPAAVAPIRTSEVAIRSAEPGAADPTRSAGVKQTRLRKFIMKVMINDSDLDAYCLDYFPDVKGKFSNGMDRVAKVNLLLELEQSDEILRRLRESEPERYARFQHVLTD